MISRDWSFAPEFSECCWCFGRRWLASWGVLSYGCRGGLLSGIVKVAKAMWLLAPHRHNDGFDGEQRAISISQTRHSANHFTRSLRSANQVALGCVTLLFPTEQTSRYNPIPTPP